MPRWLCRIPSAWRSERLQGRFYSLFLQFRPLSLDEPALYVRR